MGGHHGGSHPREADRDRHHLVATKPAPKLGGVMDLAYRILCIVFVFLAVLGLLDINLSPL
jgi:hypothetical protein